MKVHTAIAVISFLILGTVVMGMQRAGSETFAGEVSSVDVKANTLTVEGIKAGETNPETMTFKVDVQTKIESAPAAGSTREEAPSLGLKDLKAGERVNVTYVGSEGDYLARTIEVHSRPAS